MGVEPTTSSHQKLSRISLYNKLQALLRLKEREKQKEVKYRSKRHSKVDYRETEMLQVVLHLVSQNKHNRSSIKDYGNLRNVVLENDSNLLNHSY